MRVGLFWFSAPVGQELGLQRFHHVANMAMPCAVAQNSQAPLGGTPLDDLDRYTANSPASHVGLIGFEQINGARADHRTADVVHDVFLTGFPHPKAGANRPLRPIGSRTAHSASLEISPNRVFVSVLAVVSRTEAVRRGSDIFYGGLHGAGGFGFGSMGCSSANQQAQQTCQDRLFHNVNAQPRPFPISRN
jgi:hypothetical protein